MTLAALPLGHPMAPSRTAGARRKNPTWAPPPAAAAAPQLDHHADHDLPGELCVMDMAGELWVELFEDAERLLSLTHEDQCPPKSLLGAHLNVSPVLSISKYLLQQAGQRQDRRLALLQPYIEQAWAMGYNFLVLTN